MADLRRVVVTGVGTVSALGIGGAGILRTALLAGRPGVGPVRAFPGDGGPSRLAGEVEGLEAHVDADEARRLPRVSQLALVARRLALQDGGLAPGAAAGLGLVLGSHFGDFRSSATFAGGYLRRGPLGLSPLVFPNTVMNGMGAQAAIALGVRGPLLTLNQGGVAGDLAIARACALIRSRRASAVLAGGVDEISPVLFRELVRLGVTSPRGGRAGPGLEEGCRPFDRRANGTVLGEGATVVLLEEREAAEARGATLLGEVAGVAWGNLPAPAHAPPRPGDRDPRVVRRALADAGCAPEAVSAAYLTGAGHLAQDRCELDLVRAAFGAALPPLTALTPLAGDHGGLGALRVAAAAVATLGAGALPGLPDLAEPVAPELPFRTGPAAAVRAGSVLVHGVAAGGAHVALVLNPVAA